MFVIYRWNMPWRHSEYVLMEMFNKHRYTEQQITLAQPNTTLETVTTQISAGKYRSTTTWNYIVAHNLQ